MKRNLLFLMLMVVLFPLTMNADEIMVGTATGDKNVAPFVNSYPNSWLEMVYTAEEIGQACTIANISFQHVMGASFATNDLRIYLAETTKSVLANKSDWTPESELTLVYSGANVVIGDEEWESFQLDTPFEYSGEKNLAVVVAKTAGGMNMTLTWACYDAANSVMFTASDTDPSFAQYPTASALAIYGKKPVMKLSDGEESEGGEEEGEEEGNEEDDEPATLAAPTNLRATIRQDVEGFGYKFEITMAWDAVEGADGYDVYVNTATVQDYQMGYTNGTAYVAGSNTEGTLEFYVIAFNDETESVPSEPYTITIVDDAVEEMTASFNVYPNPVNDRLYIETEAEVKEVVVYDVYGRHQVTETPSHQGNMTVDVRNLSNGVYFVKVVTENGEVVKRFIKK